MAQGAASTPGTKSYYVAEAIKAARAAGIPEQGFVMQIQQESGFNPRAISPAGARGIAQFMPGTAAGLGINPDDPIQALGASARLMRSYHDKYGSWNLALAAYNGGPGVADKLRAGQSIPQETRNYIALIEPKYEPSGSIISGSRTGIPVPSQNPQPGERVVGAIGDAVGSAVDIPGRVFDYLGSIGLRVFYVIGGSVMILVGGVVVIRTMGQEAMKAVT